MPAVPAVPAVSASQPSGVDPYRGRPATQRFLAQVRTWHNSFVGWVVAYVAAGGLALVLAMAASQRFASTYLALGAAAALLVVGIVVTRRAPVPLRSWGVTTTRWLLRLVLAVHVALAAAMVLWPEVCTTYFCYNYCPPLPAPEQAIVQTLGALAIALPAALCLYLAAVMHAHAHPIRTGMLLATVEVMLFGAALIVSSLATPDAPVSIGVPIAFWAALLGAGLSVEGAAGLRCRTQEPWIEPLSRREGLLVVTPRRVVHYSGTEREVFATYEDAAATLAARGLLKQGRRNDGGRLAKARAPARH